MKKVNSMKKSRYISFLFLLIYTFQNIVQLSALTTQPYIYAKSAFIINADNGSVILNQNGYEKLGIASITKLMTIYIFLNEAKEKDIKLTDEFPISKRVASLKGESSSASGVWFNPGEKISVGKLLELALIFSDNGAAMELAEIGSGNELNHVKKMNRQAKEWGLKNTKFYNVTGLTMRDYGSLKLPGTIAADYNVSSAAELSKMAMLILKEYPKLLKETSKEYVSFNDEKLPSYNLMLPNGLHKYVGVKGLKTGTSIEAGSCFLGYFTYKDRNYISVVLGANDTDARFVETTKLYDWIKKQTYRKVYTKETNYKLNLNGDSRGNINLHPIYDLEQIDTLAINANLESIKLNEKYFKDDILIKDIMPGSIVATLEYKKLNQSSIGIVSSDDKYLEIPLIYDKKIKQQNIVSKQFEKIIKFYQGFYRSM